MSAAELGDGPPFGPVMVTGANSGIGLAIVGALLDRDVHVVATVRSDASERVVRDRFADDRLSVARLDVTDAAQCRRVVRRHAPGTIVHNAGTVELGAVMDVDDDAARAQLESTVIGPTRLSRELVELLREDDRPGRIVAISTMLTEAGIPFTGWYAAAKSAAAVLDDAMVAELRPSGIGVVRIQCGAVRTDVWSEAGDAVTAGDDAPTRTARRRWQTLTALARPLFAPPDDVGAVVADAVLARRPRAVYRVGFASRLGLVGHVVPDVVERAVTNRVFGLRRA